MNEIELLEESLERIRVRSRCLSFFFSCLLAVAIIFYCAAFVLTTCFGSIGGIRQESAMDALQLGMLVLEASIAVFMIWVLRSIFCDISKEASPFTRKQARRLRIAAVLWVAHAIVVALSSPAFLAAVSLDDVVFGATVGYGTTTELGSFIPINVGDIVLAVVLFCAALIVEYGSLLQQLSDDTL